MRESLQLIGCDYPSNRTPLDYYITCVKSSENPATAIKVINFDFLFNMEGANVPYTAYDDDRCVKFPKNYFTLLYVSEKPTVYWPRRWAANFKYFYV